MQDSDIELIRQRLSPSKLISQFIPLKRKGREWMGNCPFHAEKTPSFSVNDDRGVYYCFGCHAGGDIFKFVMEYSKASFSEAVETCADLAGVVLTPFRPENQQQRSRLQTFVDENEKISQYYQSVFKKSDGESYRKYILERGIKLETLDVFKIGAAPGNTLISYLDPNFGTAEALGHIQKSKYGKWYDRFHDRLIFPILDQKKKTIGFGGRSLDPNLNPKYTNTVDNDLFHKKHILYGIHLLDKTIETGYLAEGYLDVMAMHQAGYKNIFAPMGTAFSSNHIELLFKHFSKIVFVFDGDSAGFQAMSRAALIAIPYLIPGKELFFCVLPYKEDPHSLITSNRASLIESNKKTLIEFLALGQEEKHPEVSASSIALRRSNMLEVIESIPDFFLRSLYKDEIYDIFRSIRKSKYEKKESLSSTKVELDIKRYYELALIQLFFLDSSLYQEYCEKLPETWSSGKVEKAYQFLDEYFFKGEALEFSSFVSYIVREDLTFNSDYFLDEQIRTHVPFLEEIKELGEIRPFIEKVLHYLNNWDSLDQDIQEARVRFKNSGSREDWERLKILMTKKSQGE
jgi:DNA primase